jgi:glycine betaine/proline transport system substrate-binding protein
MTGSFRRSRSGGAFFAAFAATALLAACSGAPADTDGSGSGEGSGEGMTVSAVEFPWSGAALTNAILIEVVAQNPDLGVAEIETTALGPAPAWAGAQRGDIDLLTEVALPNQQDLADQAADQVTLVHETYGGAAQGWFVPTYALQPGQPLEGLTSVTQLNDYAAALGGRLVDADPSWVTTEQNAKRLQGYGLNLEQVTSSEAAQLAELRRAYERQEPILVYLYHPHWVFAEFDMTQLQEPTPFQPDCFTTGSGACAMPDYSAWTAASTDLQQEAPRFYAMLERFELPLADIESMLARVDVAGEAPDAVAKEWVDANPQVVQQWLAS